jgi:hypothetical protein
MGTLINDHLFQLPDLGLLYSTFIAYVLPLIFWMIFRKQIFDSNKVKGLERSLRNFRENHNLFHALFEDAPEVELLKTNPVLLAGNPKATTTLTMVTNLACEPCSSAYPVIERLLGQNPYDLNLQVIFSGNDSDRNTLASNAARRMIAIVMLTSEFNLSMLKSWYLRPDKKTFSDLLLTLPINDVIEDKAQRVLEQHYKWCKRNNVEVTPSFFLNGKMLSLEYSVYDLKYHINNFQSAKAEV